MKTIKDFKKETGINITTAHSGKMTDLYSISTSPLCNPLCMERSKNKNSVCANCYSIEYNKFRKSMRECLELNTRVLTTIILQPEDVPYINSPTGYFRIESFGDIQNTIQVKNYFTITCCNPHLKVAWWTKNPWIIEKAMKEFNLVKPDNLTIIYSSPFLNKEQTDYCKRFDFIDHEFTVFTADYCIKNNIKINCGGLSCKNCGRCYENSHDSFQIREILKQDSKKYIKVMGATWND